MLKPPIFEEVEEAQNILIAGRWLRCFLMPLYFCFQVTAVAQRNLYLNLLKETKTYQDVQKTIFQFRKSVENIKRRQLIPD